MERKICLPSYCLNEKKMKGKKIRCKKLEEKVIKLFEITHIYLTNNF